MSNPTQSTSAAASFTGGPRYPAPDIARGVMLLLIALANVPWWIKLSAESAPMTGADSIWVLLRTLFIDARAYPLFAMLFGFGLMTMVERRRAAHIATRTAELDGKAPQLAGESRQEWLGRFEEESRLDARRLLRRRGWWMLLFGFIHALLFFGDVIGAYAIVGLLFASFFAGRRWKAMTVVGIISVLVCAYMTVIQVWAIEAGKAPDFRSGSLNSLLGWFYPVNSLGIWAIQTPLMLLAGLTIAAAFIGARLAHTDFINRPDLHRRELVWVAVSGLFLAAVTGLPYALATAGYLSDAPIWALALHGVGGLFGGLGWLALLALLAGAAQSELRGWRWAASAVGRRSMTAYVGQSVLFAATFAVLWALGMWPVSQLGGALIAFLVWAVTVIGCVALERRGAKRGPLEVLLRKAVARSAKNRQVAEIPVMQA